jgi:hypothetical protein
MNRNAFLALFSGAVIMVGGIGVWHSLNVYANDQLAQGNNSQVAGISTTNQGLLQSLAGQLINKLGLVCQFTDNQGRPTTAYIKGNLVKSDMQSSDQQQLGTILIQNTRVYYWNIQTQQGYFMGKIEQSLAGTPAPKPTQTQPVQTNSATTMPTPQDIMNQVTNIFANVQNNCQIALVPDSTFTLPSNVEFQQIPSPTPKK